MIEHCFTKTGLALENARAVSTSLLVLKGLQHGDVTCHC